MSITPIRTSDGFTEPVRTPRGNAGGNTSTQNGDSKSEDRIAEPEREPENIVSGVEIIDPIESEFIDGGTGEPGTATNHDGKPKRRGRPPGSRNRPREEKTPENLGDLKALLLSVHFMGAKMLSAPELELSEEEAAKLSGAITNVAKYYSMTIDPKKMAIIQLAFCMGGIYGPRIKAMTSKSKNSTQIPPTKPPEEKRGPVFVPKKDATTSTSNILENWIANPVAEIITE